MVVLPRRPLLASLAATLLLTAAVAAFADPTPPFIEHWNAPGTAGWGGGLGPTNPGTGGVLGAGDGFLEVAVPTSHQLGSVALSAPYTGNWIAAGANKVRFYLEDTGDPNPLEIHLSIGNQSNFWQCNTGFVPASGVWTQFSVDLTQESNFTQIIASPPGQTYTEALQNVTRVLVRHDNAPYTQSPDFIAGDFGLDEFEILHVDNTGVPLPGVSVAMPVDLAPPYPNPSRGPVALSLLSHDASEIRLDVLDVTGRVVRRATLAAASPGSRLWTWDGRTDRGDVAPAGYYRVRAYSAAGGTSQPLVRLGSAR
jgi:hypothetical protein